MNAPFVVAIDGPAGAGKSTVGRRLAQRLGLEYLDTGAMYRAVTWSSLRHGVDPDDGAAVMSVLSEMTISFDPSGRSLVDGVDVAEQIRTPEVNAAVSQVAAISGVRSELVRRQRDWVNARGGAVVEGRDIGTVVFPDAALKLYITASARVRAARRVAELGGDIDAVEAAIVERDRRDSTRADSPLGVSSDMEIIDTTSMSVDAVVDQIVDEHDLRTTRVSQHRGSERD